MSNIDISSPRIDLDLIQRDEFYLFYEMMIKALETDDVKEGINKSLYFLRKFLNSGTIVLFNQQENGEYIYKVNDTIGSDVTLTVNCIVNKVKPLLESKKELDLNLDLNEDLKDLMLFHMNVEDNNCVLAIVNNDKSKNLDPQFWIRLKNTMKVIIKRAASYERNMKAVTTDLLTGLDNRDSYEMRKANIDEADDNLLVAVFDLFSLKYVNDNFSHEKGDVYIKAVADILKKYWPKQTKTYSDEIGELYKDTGHCVYRYGGDEFVLLTTIDDLKLAEAKAQLAAEEAKIIDFGVETPITPGINYGIAKHNPGESFKETFVRADEAMQEDKRNMYLKYNVERRKL